MNTRVKILTREAMVAERARLKAEGKTLVFTNGAFDILHAGHVTYLEFARRQGDALCVGLNSDASVKRYKGDLRPVNPQDDRARVLAALACVDYVVIFDEDEPKDLIAALIPDVLVKGADWAHYVSGRDIVEAHGGRVVLAQMVEGRSTTNVINRVVEVYGRFNKSESESESESESKSKSESNSKSESESSLSFTSIGFGHEKLVCYQLAYKFIAWLKTVLPEGKSSLGDLKSQVERSALSISLNIAEGNGKRERPIRAKFFDDARGSAAECAACLDALAAIGSLDSGKVEEGKRMLNRIAALLSGLIDRYQSQVLRESSPEYGGDISRSDADLDSDLDSDSDTDLNSRKE